MRPAQPGDASSLAGFAERVFRETFAADNDPDDLEQFLAATYGPEIQAREIADPVVVTLLGELDRTLVAYAQLGGHQPAPPEIEGVSALHLWRFYVDRAHHGRGLAQGLMAHCREVGRQRGAGSLWLTVWEKNPRAIAFYLKLGFVDVGTTTFQVGRDLQIDRLMALALG